MQGDFWISTVLLLLSQTIYCLDYLTTCWLRIFKQPDINTKTKKVCQLSTKKYVFVGVANHHTFQTVRGFNHFIESNNLISYAATPVSSSLFKSDASGVFDL